MTTSPKRLACIWSAGALAGCMLLAPLDPPPDGGGGFAGAPAGGPGAQGGAQGGQPEPGGVGGSPAGAPPAIEAGSGGEGATPGACTTNAECSRENFDEPYRCRRDGTCVALATPECPLVYGEPNDDNAIFVGSFATRESTNLADSTTVFTYRLAFDELNGDGIGGLPGGPEGHRRPLVLLVCHNDESHFHASMEHLANAVQVPAILASMDTGPLVRAFDEYGGERIFFLSPFGGSRELSSKADQGLIWSMLGQPSDFAGIYKALLERVEIYLKNAYPIPTLRVAAVRTTDAFSAELADAVLTTLNFNDLDTTENLDAGNLLPLTLRPEDAQSDANATTQAILEFKPHVILSLSNESFVANTGVLRFVEAAWGSVNAGQPRPFYVLSPKNIDRIQETLGDVVAGQTELNPLAHQRFLAIGAAPAADRSLYNSFLVRLAQSYPRARAEAENLYDAFYFLAYAMYGAGSVAELTGPGIARGMLRLLSNDPIKEVTVGPSGISGVFGALSNPSATVRLMGTLGPPDFDSLIGGRIESGSVSCFDPNATIQEHVLRYERESGMLLGDFSPCYAGF